MWSIFHATAFIPGQFWNIPVTVTPHTGLLGGQNRTDDYVITVRHPDSAPRNFIGLKAGLTWESESTICYYVGNKQAGGIWGVSDARLNGPVIEGHYQQYKVSSLFSTNYMYSHFNEANC